MVQALDGVVGQEGKEAGGIWEEGVEALRTTFRSTTIADIARREAEGAGAGHVPHLGGGIGPPGGIPDSCLETPLESG